MKRSSVFPILVVLAVMAAGIVSSNCGSGRALADEPAAGASGQRFESRIVGPATAPALAVTMLDSPYRARYPDDSDWAYARTIKDMILYQGRVYVGAGDLNNNAGPADIYSIAPGENKFTLEYTAPDEEVSAFYVFEGRLIIPGHDPQESWDFGNLYVKESGRWRKVRTLPQTIHCLHLGYHKGLLFADGRDSTLVSSDWGLTWKTAEYDQKPTPGKFVVINDRMCDYDGLCLFVWEHGQFRYKGNRTCGSQTRAVFGFASVLTRYQRGCMVQMPRKNPVWRDFCLYDLYYLPDLVSQPVHISAFGSRSVLDILVEGKLAYALTSLPEAGRYANAIYSSTDLKRWRCVVSFDASPGFPSAFAKCGGEFYVAVQSPQIGQYTVKDGGAWPHVDKCNGDVLRVTPK